MKYPSLEFDSTVAALCHGTATEDQAAALFALLESEPAARDEYLWQVELHARLATTDDALAAPGPGTEPSSGARGKLGLFVGGAAAAVLLLAVVSWQAWWPVDRPAETVAHFGDLRDVRWVAADVEHQVGEGIQAGQRVELSAGQARIDFLSGASVLVEGPAIFEVEAANAGFLLLGRLTATATTPASRGFTIRTRTARAIDLGTEFTAEAAADGHSQFGVRSGEVEVLRDGTRTPQHLGEGDLLAIEAGKQQVMVRVERGDETPAFRFPTIEPPSDRDYADARQGQAVMKLVQGTLSKRASSGSPEVLLDGRGQSQQDSPDESVFFLDGTSGRLLLDLGRVVTIHRINTYSWHQNGRYIDNRLRALQKYTLYGFAGDALPPTDGDPGQAGWVPIARVNTDEFFRVVRRLDRPAQQACSITSASGSLGRYRYLLWDLQPSRHPDFRQLNNSFYGEFDVYAQP